MLWSEAVVALEREGQGFAAMIAKEVTLLSFEKDHLVGGLPRSKEFEFVLFSEGRADLVRHLSRLHGRPVELTVEIRDDIPEKDSPDDSYPTDLEMTEGDPPPPASPPPEDDEEEEPDSAPAAVEGDAQAPEPEVEAPEVFYQDPLIERALEIFDGKILKASSSPSS